MFELSRLNFLEKLMVTKSKSSYGKTTSKKGVSKRSKRDYQKGRELPVQPKAELKCLDIAQTAVNFHAIAVPPTMVCLNPVTNGAEIYQRTGRKIYMKSVHIKGTLVPVIANVDSLHNAILRMIVFYDAQPNAAFPAIATLLKDSTAGGATTEFSELNLDNRERFKILREKVWVMGPTTATAASNYGQAYIQDGSQCLVINEFIKLKKIEALYNATNGGTIADLTSGSIVIVLIADAVTTDSVWAMSYTSRLRYYD